MAMNFGSNGMVRPGPAAGSTFAGGSFSPRRRMTPPTSTSTMPGKRVGWDGGSRPPGVDAGYPSTGFTPMPDPRGYGQQPMHRMPDGSMMPGPSMGDAKPYYPPVGPLPPVYDGALRPGSSFAFPGGPELYPTPYPPDMNWTGGTPYFNESVMPSAGRRVINPGLARRFGY